MSQLDPIYYGYLVDPFAYTVTVVEFDRNKGLEQFYAYMTHDAEEPVTGFESAYSELDEMPGFLCDEDGLWKQRQAWTDISGKYEPVQGKFIALDTDDEGHSVTPAMSLERFKQHLMFVEILGVSGDRIVTVPKGRPK